MGVAVAPRQGIALEDIALEKCDRGMTAEFWVRSQKKIGVAT